MKLRIHSHYSTSLSPKQFVLSLKGKMLSLVDRTAVLNLNAVLSGR